MRMTHFSDIQHMSFESWFECWYKDKQNMLRCMYSNLSADLSAGYNPLGNTIKAEKAAIATYEKDIKNTLENFATMDEKQIEKWCYFDLLKRGAIE